jgi:hypothetical protein
MGEIWIETGKSKRNPKTIKIGLLRSEIKGMFLEIEEKGKGKKFESYDANVQILNEGQLTALAIDDIPCDLPHLFPMKKSARSLLSMVHAQNRVH